MDELVPLMNIESIATRGSPFYVFLHFYSQLTDSIDFFWLITYKTLFYVMLGDDMDKRDCSTFACITSQVRTTQNTKQTIANAVSTQKKINTFFTKKANVFANNDRANNTIRTTVYNSKNSKSWNNYYETAP
jgi:hypothetical protein